MDAAPDLRRKEWFSFLPGAAGSFLIHAMVLLIAGSALRGCQKTQTGEPGGAEFRDVGLFVVDGSADDSPNSGEGIGQAAKELPENANSIAVEPVTPTRPVESRQSLVPEEAPDLRQLMGQDNATVGNETTSGDVEVPSVIGAGMPIASGAISPSGGGALISPSGNVGQQAVGTPQVGPGQTAFMNIADSGNSFVYVIDVSASMGEDNRLQVAKSQLKASLRLLQPNQQFQVIFYSESTTRMRLRRQPARDTYFATTANILQAVQEVDRVQPERGTEHKPALVEALSLEPDVVYFLTDGREPQLSPADLRDIKAMARRTTIHVVEFGSGLLEDRSTSWLERLARQSNGEYRAFGIGR